MKTILLTISFSWITILSFGQEKLLDILPLTENRVTYSEVVQVEGLSKDELYDRAKRWFVTTYKSAKEVIQLDDKENGEIIGKGTFNVSYYARSPYIGHAISISVKDGRYKYVISDLNYSDNQGEKFIIEDFPKSWAGKKKLYTTVDEEVKLVIASIEKAMKSNKKDDW